MSNEVSRGLLLVLSSPSGAGKTTLARRLAAEFDLRFSVSYTTRSPRTGEVEGKDYFFVSGERFDQMVANQEFAEWAVVHGNRYGTSIAAVQQSITGGIDCLFDVDYQGGQQIRRLWPADSVFCFILPPSMEELESRLRRRATDAPDVIERRLAMACKELEHYGEYDYLVVNDDLSRAYDQLRSIFVAARCARSRRDGVAQALLAQAAARPAFRHVMVTIDAICESVRQRNPNADIDLIRRSHSYAAESHTGQFRKSGDPYLVHPMSVAKIIADLNLDVPSICAGILHDCVEDTTATPEDIRDKFGEEIQHIVEGVTKLGQIPWTTREERQAENFRKMLLAMARDIRVILVKLADRVHNMRTLQFMSRDKQERIARETREIYAPIANRLGIQWMKIELEDLAFKYLEPQDWENLHGQMEGTEAERSAYILDVCAKLRQVLAENEINGQVSGRAKGYWSIHQKMKRTGRDLEQVYDIVAFRIITDSVRDCYGTLGTIHSNWTPVPGRFKDYIALPKPNLYQSLHTTVIGPGSERMEVQIRTQAMHRTAEEGIAAHWQYKEQSPLGSEDRKTFAWLHQLMEWQRDLKDPAEFIQTVKIDLFEEEVFVFTPKGDVKALPKGATPIDFAYAVHSKIGDQCSGARVNGMMVPLRYLLRNGDIIDIITSPTQRPSKDWIKFVVTSRAQTKIRHHLRKEQRDRSRRLGRDLLTKALRNHHRSLAVAEKDKLLDKAAEALHLGTGEEIFVHVGYGKLSPEAAAAAIYPQLQSADLTSDSLPAIAEEARAQPRREPKRSVGGVRVQGEADIVVRFAKCCSPVPGDAIVAFISRGRGVIVHTRQCQKAFNLDPARSVEVSWDEETRLLRPVAVEVVSEDKPGILAALSKCFMEHGVNIAQAKCRATDDHRGLNTFQVTVSHVDQLQKVLRAIQGIDGVISAIRL